MTDTKLSRVCRLWSKLKLKPPKRSPRKRRCGSDIHIPSSNPSNGVWTYDVAHDYLANGRLLKMLCVLDENTGECLAIKVSKSLRNQSVILTLSRLMRIYGKPAFIHSNKVPNSPPRPS